MLTTKVTKSTKKIELIFKGFYFVRLSLFLVLLVTLVVQFESGV